MPGPALLANNGCWFRQYVIPHLIGHPLFLRPDLIGQGGGGWGGVRFVAEKAGQELVKGCRLSCADVNESNTGWAHFAVIERPMNSFWNLNFCACVRVCVCAVCGVCVCVCVCVSVCQCVIKLDDAAATTTVLSDAHTHTQREREKRPRLLRGRIFLRLSFPAAHGVTPHVRDERRVTICAWMYVCVCMPCKCACMTPILRIILVFWRRMKLIAHALTKRQCWLGSAPDVTLFWQTAGGDSKNTHKKLVPESSWQSELL